MKIERKAEIIAKRLEEAGLFTNRFGTFGKSDYEVLLFSIYLDMLDRKPRDYEISIDLGITESKVRSLRVKSQLLYHRELKWEKELESALNNGYYNPQDRTITVMIEDPSVQRQLKNEIEKAYGPVHLSFNPKLLCLPIESYLILAMALEPDKDAALDKLNEQWLRSNEEAETITRESLLKRVWSKMDKTEPIKILLDCACLVWPGGAPFLKVISRLIPDM